MGQPEVFPYGARETDYLKRKDKKMAAVIDRVGHIERTLDESLFPAVVRHIVGQQISTKAQQTIWQRVRDDLGEVDAARVLAAGIPRLQGLGMSFRKAEYITDFAQRVADGRFRLDEVAAMADDEAIAALASLRGIGVWTAEMILLFSLKRTDVLSFGDLAIQRGMRMLYRHREITRPRFERYRKRYSPYGSVASLYLWAVSGGALPELTDPGEKRGRKRRIESPSGGPAKKT